MAANDRPRLLLVDDHPIFLKGVRHTLEMSGEFDIVGEAPDGQRAIQLAEQLQPEVILCDINLPGMSGFEVTRVIKRRLPQVNVIMLSVYEDDEQLFNAIQAGAAAYSAKDVSPDRLLEIVRNVARGQYPVNESILSKPVVASKMLKRFREFSAAQNSGNETVFAPLTNREVEILDCIARGNSNKEIARILNISDQTVKNHITSILKKLNANDRTQAVITALRHGWIKMANDLT